MKKMTSVTIEYRTMEGRPKMLLFFPYDQTIIRELRKFPNCSWSGKKRCWMLDYSKDTRQKLLEKLASIAVLSDPLQKSDKLIAAILPGLPDTSLKALEHFKQWMHSKRYSASTVHTYTEALQLFLRFSADKAIDDICNDDIIAFNNRYLLANGLSVSYQNQMVNAIKLFFEIRTAHTLDIQLVHRPRAIHRLPNVLSMEEVKQILTSSRNLKHRTMLSLIYSCGLRRGELLALKPEHVDSKRNLLLIKNAKGNKDRVAPLSEKTIVMLREYYMTYKPKVYLFEGMIEGEKYDERSLQHVLKQCVERAGITKPVTLHWLRHSYATHLLENGTDLRYIQEILGHKSSRTTEIYTHVSTRSLQRIISPFDLL